MPAAPNSIPAFLESSGWYRWYNDRYWCHEQFAAPGVDSTTRGMSPEEAYAFETDPASREKTLQGMSLANSAARALSNLGIKAASNFESGGSSLPSGTVAS